MKKLGTKLTEVLSLVLVFSMVLGSTSKAFASVDNHGFNEDKTTIHSNDSKYNDDEVAKVINGNQSTSDKLDSAADAQDAVKTVEDAAYKAEKAVEEVADLLLDAQQQKATAVSGAAVAATENSNIETAVTKLGEAENALDAKVEDEKNAEATLKLGVENYNATVETAQKAIDAAVEKLDTAIKSADQNSDDMLDKAKELKKAAIEALEATVNSDDQARIENAAKVAEILEQASDLATKANSNQKAAERDKKKAIAEYNTYAKMYGMPLYGETEVTYNKDEATEAAKKAGLESANTDIQNTDLESLESAIREAEREAQTAQDNRDQAIAAAQTAIAALNKDASDAATDIENAKAALEEAKEADKTVKEYADDTINYYVNKAQASLDETNKKIDANNANLKAARQSQAAAQTAYNDAVASLTKTATDAYNAELSRRKAAMDAAVNKYNRASGWDRFWNVGNVCTNKDDAIDAYYEYNRESVKNSIIDTTLKSSKEYSALQQSINTTNSYINVERALNNEKSAKSDVLGRAQAAVSQAEATYLKDLEDAGDEAIANIVAALENQATELGSGINQVQYDQDTFEWSQNYFNTWNIITKGNVRRTLNDYYGASFWEKLGDAVAAFQWTVSGDDIDGEMDKIMANLAEQIRIAEEKKADVIARSAELEADAAIKAAADEVEKAQRAAGEINGHNEGTVAIAASIENLDAQCSEAIEKAENRITAAEENLKTIKENAQNAIDSLKGIDLIDLLTSINEAQKAIEEAKQQVKDIRSIQKTIKDYNNLAAQYAKYDDENSKAELPTATAFAQLANDEIATGNEANFDEINPGVVSRGTSSFTQVSDSRQLTVPEDMFKAYLEEVVAHEKNSDEGVDYKANGRGIATGDAPETENATMPFVYWELDENGRLTGNYFTDATKLDGQYFLGYSFKREADMDTAGYHIDGYFVTLERKEEEKQPETTVVVTENGQLALNTGYEPVVLLDTVEVPEGAPEVIETEDEIEVIDLDTPVETPESAVEVLPQTGTASAVLFYILGAGCITLGGVVAHKARKEEE